MKPRENSNLVSEQSHFSLSKTHLHTFVDNIVALSSPSTTQSAGAKFLRVDTLKICNFNLLAAELLFFLILAHPVHKIWIKQETNMLELWNKLHFEEKETESIYRV